MPKVIRITSEDLEQEVPRNLVYTSCDENEYVPQKRPKWQSPTSDGERTILNAAHRKYYPDKERRHKVVMISKSMIPLASGVIGKYPTEWVDAMCTWALKMWANGNPITLDALLTAINNSDAKNEFVARWHYKHKDVHLTPLEEYHGT